MSPIPLVSVVIPTYNRAATIERAARSVLNQTFRDLEMIVVDDCSGDDTLERLSRLQDPRMRILRHARNQGAGAGRNTGLAAARGTYVAFQDSDDEWLVDKLDAQIAALEAAPEAVGAYCAKIIYGIDRDHIHGGRRASVVPDWSEDVLGGDIAEVLRTRNLISTQTLVIRRAVMERMSGFDPRLKNSIDWDFVLRLSELGPILFVDQPLVVAYRMHDSISLPSRKSAYSHLMIVNKMRRRGVGGRAAARHLAGIGTRLGYYGKPRSGRRLIGKAIEMDRGDPRLWLRLAASYAPGFARALSSWRKGFVVAADRR